MVLFPAIDILSGKAVRLYKGDYNAVTVYSERPWEFAEDFVDKGCSAIHIVDLDGAKSGETVNIVKSGEESGIWKPSPDIWRQELTG